MPLLLSRFGNQAQPGKHQQAVHDKQLQAQTVAAKKQFLMKNATYLDSGSDIRQRSTRKLQKLNGSVSCLVKYCGDFDSAQKRQRNIRNEKIAEIRIIWYSRNM